MSDKSKDYYTTSELVKQSWFPIKSTLTIKKLVETGELEGVNVSTNPLYKRYRIPKDSALAFVKRRTTNKK